jgi:hypothetical protein
MLSQDQKKQFVEQGYVIVQGIAPELMDAVLAAADRTAEKAYRKEWLHARPSPEGDVWGVSSLLNPELHEPIFAEYLACPQVLEVAFDLMGTRELRLSLTNMLINPQKTPYQIPWHRDAGDPKDTGEAELAVLRLRQTGIQWNCALTRESCLRIVPGSHRRNMTDAERDVLFNHPFDPMPNELRVDLQPGMAVYYNAMLLHKGDYPADVKRRTLHANFVTMDEPVPFKMHYNAVQFMEETGFADRLPAALRPLHANWLKFADRCKATA